MDKDDSNNIANQNGVFDGEKCITPEPGKVVQISRPFKRAIEQVMRPYEETVAYVNMEAAMGKLADTRRLLGVAQTSTTLTDDQIATLEFIDVRLSILRGQLKALKNTL